MTDERFNGWTNWDTWNAHLWLSNDEGSYHEMTRQTRHGSDEAKNARVEEVGRELIGLMGNMDGINLDAVDWEEVREAFEEE